MSSAVGASVRRPLRFGLLETKEVQIYCGGIGPVCTITNQMMLTADA